MAELRDFWVFEEPNPDDRHWRWVEFSERIRELAPNAKNRIMDEAYRPSVDGCAVTSDEPIPLKVLRGARKSDVLGNGCGLAIYSTRLVRALEASRCKGLRVHPAVLYDQADREVIDRDLWWVKVQVGAGPPDLTRGSSLISTDLWRRDINMTDAYGLYFDPTTWTGFDIFRFPRGWTVLVTNRIADVVQKGEFDGFNLEAVPEYGKALRDLKVADLKRAYPNGPPPARSV